MKVILSRKGFDSQYGGGSSPILPDGRIISLPIPSDNDCFSYGDLKLDDQTYYDLMHELGIKNEILEKKCHLDPDIYKNIIERKPEWKPLFGQRSTAQGHLNNQGVKPGDIFLFFGTFQKTKITKEGKLKFHHEDKPKHVIFGYFQIDRMIKNKKDVEEWMRYHSHYEFRGDWNENNTLYVAKDTLSWNASIPGAGVFKYNKSLVLTADGKSKSIWDIPILQGKKISYHDDASWKGGVLKTVGRGQEFVIDDDLEVERWVKKLLEENCLNEKN